ncbi:cytochrome P450 [Jeotgalibacillus sp. S-D1]|uniref:bifunctional cytochrome P450/NADPH--P450 reductase n=1 Tax=Jeotgalibacillus sp. S-D1 TaxID=2552189 RepID=UPI00105A7A91|nr:bifunctional cytochrome P450/NADPH--P450 reductase [Jeotgalibacillus sp. S-D1]TDL30998.1 cytochrome P450 [Jeotgalibacillus sp. S-D1]
METMYAIPQPKTYGPLGNLPLINKDKPTLSLCKLADEHGPIFRFNTPASDSIIISSPELVAEVCDESRFDKSIEGALEKVRAFGGDGLFTSWTHEPNWQKAHNILMPTFSKRAMKGYHSMMIDIATQLVQKWERLNPNESIDVPEDMTRLTLDTIGLCGFNYRFNSYYRETPHPFINSMVRALDESMHQLQRMDLQDKLMVKTKRQYNQDIQEMNTLVDNIIAERKASEDQNEKDLLSLMLHAKDPETGERLDDENIRYQIITFLIAGHETTSGLLSFALYYLLKNPEKLQKAYEEVDRVLTDDTPTYKQVTQLDYVKMILNESLRLWPTAPAFSLNPKKDTVIGGKYPIKKGEKVTVLIPQLHRDRGAWGNDAEEFKPERFEDPSKVPNDAYKPFGNGQRACIGMQFALHEATLVLGMILKQFQLMDHSDYELDIKQTLTLKPGDFTMRVKSRSGQRIQSSVQQPVKEEENNKKENIPSSSLSGVNDRELLVLYGSDMGTAEGIANELADTASLYGVKSEVATLNDRIGQLPKDGAVIIVTASYNGKPPRTAVKFVEWLTDLNAGELDGVHYTVFGCGDRNWASTYQDVPRLIDQQLEQKGAVRFSDRGEGDASGDFEEQFDQWRSRMWEDTLAAFDLELNEEVKKDRSTLSVEFVSGQPESPLVRTYGAVRAVVKDNRELQLDGSERSTRHVEIQLPKGVTYQEGDHLGVLPTNSEENVHRVLTRFDLNGEDQLLLTASGHSAAHLPLDRPVSLFNLFSSSVELQEPATRAQIRELAQYTVCPPHKVELEKMTEEDNYKEEILTKRISMLDLMEKYEACELPFERFLELLRPLKPRYYSISSSPKVNSEVTSITVSVVRGAAWKGHSEYRGVASNYLSDRKAGEELLVFVRTPETRFQLPEDPMTPVIMVGPGTGVAPFRGFLQARSALKNEGKSLGEAHLYFGCRNDMDFIYRKELEQFKENGIVTLHTAYSRVQGSPKTYVQHLMADHTENLIRILGSGGKLYVCGDGTHMAGDVEAALLKAYQTVNHTDADEAKIWLDQLQQNGSYAKDVWAGS